LLKKLLCSIDKQTMLALP